MLKKIKLHTVLLIIIFMVVVLHFVWPIITFNYGILRFEPELGNPPKSWTADIPLQEKRTRIIIHTSPNAFPESFFEQDWRTFTGSPIMDYAACLVPWYQNQCDAWTIQLNNSPKVGILLYNYYDIYLFEQINNKWMMMGQWAASGGVGWEKALKKGQFTFVRNQESDMPDIQTTGKRLVFYPKSDVSLQNKKIQIHVQQSLIPFPESFIQQDWRNFGVNTTLTCLLIDNCVTDRKCEPCDAWPVKLPHQSSTSILVLDIFSIHLFEQINNIWMEMGKWKFPEHYEDKIKKGKFEFIGNNDVPDIKID